MAKINVTSGTASAYGQGELQLQNKAPMDSTLRFVTDSANTASPLKLSTSLVQSTSTLKITTNDNPYIDAEDGSGNNRFTVGRDTGSQQVNVDFASNPGGSTTIVGAIRTYVDGVNLSEVMAFREDGNIGINTLTPGAKLDIHSASNVILQINRTGAGKSWLQYLQAGTARWNTGYDNTNGNFTIYDAVAAADRMVVTNTGNVGIGTTTPADILDIYDIDSTAAIRMASAGAGSKVYRLTSQIIGVSNTGFAIRNETDIRNELTIDGAGNVGIGTSTPSRNLEVSASNASVAIIGTSSSVAKLELVSGGVVNWSLRTNQSAASDFTLYQDSTERLLFSSTGYLRLSSGTGGIQFNGDTAAANALDDYEEGTWTPTVNNPGGTGSASYTSQLGTYTKIGRQVVVSFYVIFAKNTLSGGTLLLSGLPFTSQADIYPESAILIDGLATDLSNPLIQVAASSTNADLIQNNGGTGSHVGLSVNTYLGAGNMNLRGTMTYFV